MGRVGEKFYLVACFNEHKREVTYRAFRAMDDAVEWVLKGVREGRFRADSGDAMRVLEMTMDLAQGVPRTVAYWEPTEVEVTETRWKRELPVSFCRRKRRTGDWL